MDIIPIGSTNAAQKTDLPSKKTFAGFDALRACAALAVVLLHACVPYLQNPMPGLIWSVRDTPSRAVDFVFWGIEVTVMPVFLILAGFLAWQTLQHRGPGQLTRSRAKRLLIPLLFGMLVVLPLDLYMWAISWVGEGHVAPVKLKSLKFAGVYGENAWGLSHLWFLLYLFLYVVVLGVVASTIRRIPQSYLTNKFAKIKTLTLLLFVIGVAVLTFRPEVVWGFQHDFAPVPSKWIYSGTFFAGGLILAYYDRRLIRSQFFAQRMIVPAACLLIATVALGRWQLGRWQLATQDPSLASSFGLAVATTASAWLVTLCLIGVATKRIQQVPLSIQYLAAASFWIYLVHHPIVGLVHTDLKILLPSVSPIAKTMLAFGISVGFSLLTYESFVRKTKLGRWLGFAWTIPSKTDQEINQESEPVQADGRFAA